jgi:hypothetical protein
MSILIHKQNVYSQNGEDGIIAFILARMNITTNGRFVEFGAWDGIFLSNTYQLFKEHNWSGVYIEADEVKYAQLCYNFKDYKNRIDCVNAYVGFGKTDTIDHVIDASHFKDKEIDLLSIDVDGLDYNIFEKMERYSPKIICIEVNAGHSPLYDQVIPIHVAQNNIGQSMKVISDLAARKGYFPLCYTGNLFLIKNEYRYLFIEFIKPLDEMYLDFLDHLESTNKGGLKHLYDTFVVKTEYNGFEFNNKYLKVFFNLIKQHSSS